MSKLTNAEFNKDFHFRDVQSCFDCQYSIFVEYAFQCIHSKRMIPYEMDGGTYTICDNFREEI